MYRILLYGLCIWGMPGLWAQALISAQYKTTYTANWIGLQTGQPAVYDVAVYHLIYETLDYQQDTVLASGALLIPLAVSTSPILSWQHGAILKKDRVPSRLFGLLPGLYFATDGYVVSMPDYLGLGDGLGIHPFLHADTEASASLDMLLCARQFMEDSLNIVWDGQCFLCGFSQGAHASLALQRLIEQGGYAAVFPQLATVAIAGPYDLSGSQMLDFADSILTYPAFLPYIQQSYQTVYGTLFNHWSEYYQFPYDTIIPVVLDGTHSLSDLNAVLPNNAFALMEDSVLTPFLADTPIFQHHFRIALAQNDLMDWHAQKSLRLCYCTGDELVAWQNSVLAANQLQANGSLDVLAVNIGPNLSHTACLQPGLLYARNYFNTFINPFNLRPYKETEGLSPLPCIQIYPNPGNGVMNIQIKERPDWPIRFRLLHLNGSVLWEKQWTQSGYYMVDLQKLPAGLYIWEAWIYGRRKQGKYVLLKGL